MNVSHEHRCLFFHVPKAAGCSIAELGFLQYKGHIRAVDVRRAHPSIWREYFKFCFVRNPWDRFLSAYCYFANMQQDHRWYQGPNIQVVKQVKSFGSFDAFCQGFESTNLWRDSHFRPQMFWIASSFGKILMDHVGRIETLEADFAAVCTKIGVPSRRVACVNRSDHPPYTEYYTSKLRKIVADLYRRDIRSLNYTFSNGCTGGFMKSRLGPGVGLTSTR